MTGDPADVWFKYADTTKTGHDRKQDRAALKREAKREAAKREQEAIELPRLYRLQRRQDIERAMSDDVFGSRVSELRKFLRRITLDDRDEIVERMSEPWLVHAPFEIRWECLRMASHHIIRARVKEELPEFDDGMPGDGEGVFHTIRRRLGVI